MATIETDRDGTDVVALTERAADKVRALMAQEPAGEAEVLRVAVQGGGCGGFEYALGFDRGASGRRQRVRVLRRPRRRRPVERAAT